MSKLLFKDPNKDPNVGKSRQTSNSASGLVSTLIPVLITAVVMTTIFLILRRTQERQYAPRSYLGSLREQERSPPLPKTLFGWIPAINKVRNHSLLPVYFILNITGQIPDTYVLQHNSLDGYFLLRFLKIAVVICFVGCCITWPVLFPVNATGGAGKVQLDLLTFGEWLPIYLSLPICFWLTFYTSKCRQQV
jgi:calcium permeable stress-gated cation channel